jgi:hypothetical protein
MTVLRATAVIATASLLACAHPQETPLNPPGRETQGRWIDVADFGAGEGRCPGGDDAACIQRAIASLGRRGGTLFLPPAEYILRSTIDLGVQEVSAHAGTPVILQGSGRQATILRYVGGKPNASIVHANTAHFGVRDLAMQLGTDDLPATCLDIVDSVYFDVSRVSCWAAFGARRNRLRGVVVRSTKKMVPPPGSGHITDFVYYAADGSAAEGSRGILVDGSEGEPVTFMVVDGWGDIENAEVGVEFNMVANSVLSGPYLIEGGRAGIVLKRAQYNAIRDVRVQYIACEHATENGCSIEIDEQSFDNIVEHPDFFEPHNHAVRDRGVRTVWLTTGDAGIPTRLPARVEVGSVSSDQGRNVETREQTPRRVIPPRSAVAFTVPLPGATPGDPVAVGFEAQGDGKLLLFSAQVVDADRATVTVFNASAREVEMPSGNVRVRVLSR